MSIYKGTEFIAGTPDLSDYAKTTDLLNAVYPVGSLYFCTQSTCPLSAVISGSTWEKVGSSIITSVNTSVPIKGNGKSLGLTDGTYNRGIATYSDLGMQTNRDGFNVNVGKELGTSDGTPRKVALGITTDSSKSGIVGTVTSSSLTVNIFKRTA